MGLGNVSIDSLPCSSIGSEGLDRFVERNGFQTRLLPLCWRYRKMKNVARLTIPATPNTTPQKIATFKFVGSGLFGDGLGAFVLVACAVVIAAEGSNVVG
jgi:hypothetical protein